MRRRIPPLNAIRAFEAVARHEHLGRAAEELYVSHSALSQQVKLLEGWFGVELFTREKGRLILKPEGRELLTGYTQALDALQNASLRLQKRDEERSLVIQCDPAFFSKCLMKKMLDLRETAGSTNIDIITSHSLPETFPEHADIVIHFQQHPGWKGVHSAHLVDIYGFPACSPALLERSPAPEQPEDLNDFHLLHGDDRESWNSWLKEYCNAPVAGRRQTFYDDFSLTIQAAVNGDGVIMADPILCRAELASGQLIPLFTGTVFEVSYTAFCPAVKYKNSTVKAVYDRLVKEMNAL